MKNRFRLLISISIFAIGFSHSAMLYSASNSLNEIQPGAQTQADLINLIQEQIESIKASNPTQTKFKVRLNIFVHGTVASISNGFSPKKVLDNQDMAGSWAENLVRNFCRKDLKIHFNNSIIYNEGFYRIEQTKESDGQNKREFGLFPIIDAFKTAQAIANEGYIELYYLFGWSGMLSQYERIKSALCFFNALTQEKECIEKALNSFTDYKLELATEVYGHSHGSNVSLLLGLVDSMAKNYDLWDTYACFNHHVIYERQKETLKSIIEKYCAPRTRDEQAKEPKFNMEKWLLTPQKRSSDKPLVDRLFMLAGPIQPENFPLGFCNTFGRVENWFSPSDKIQKLDQFSVPSRTCFRFIDSALISSATEKCKTIEPLELERKNRFFQREIVYKNVHKKEGPSHLEFWMVSFKNKNKPSIRPIPFLCLIPLLANDSSIFHEQDMSIALDLNYIDSKGIECHKVVGEKSCEFLVIKQELLQSLKEVLELEQELIKSPVGDKNKSKIRGFLLTARAKLVESIATS